MGRRSIHDTSRYGGLKTQRRSSRSKGKGRERPRRQGREAVVGVLDVVETQYGENVYHN